MDDIRNTSALFVGGQDTAPHTERTARELWQLLFQKTENEMAGYPLNAAEKDVLLRKMDAFCMEQTGMSLREYAQQLHEEQAQTAELQL